MHSLYEMPSYVNGNIQFSPPFALHAPSSDDVSDIVGRIEFEFVLITHSLLPVTSFILLGRVVIVSTFLTLFMRIITEHKIVTMRKVYMLVKIS